MKLFMLIVICTALYSCSPRQAVNGNNTMELASTASFSTDKGESFHDAVVVNGVRNQREGVAAEYRFISDLHGQRGQDWFLIGQTIIQNQNKLVDVVEIQLNNPPTDRKIIYFDATGFLLRN